MNRTTNLTLATLTLTSLLAAGRRADGDQDCQRTKYYGRLAGHDSFGWHN